jgi:hypothetical protein
MGICPAVKIKPPDPVDTAWLYGPIAAGACSVVIIFFNSCPPYLNRKFPVLLILISGPLPGPEITDRSFSDYFRR